MLPNCPCLCLLHGQTDGADASNGGGKIWGVLQGEAGRMVAEAESLEAEHPALAPYVRPASSTALCYDLFV